MINPLPYEHFTIRTNLSAEEVNRRLVEAIEPYDPQWIASSSHKSYQGDLSAVGFQVKRVVFRRGSYLPRISGTIGSDMGQTTIEIRMKLNPLVIAFMSVYVALVGFIMATSIIRGAGGLILTPWLALDGSILRNVLLGSIMILGGIGVMIISFKIESTRSSRFFRELLDDTSDW